ncbi:MAG TPA: ABC transporter permease subunit [Anaerolineae bacterium]|nr:ABC transporter permease subunit [Anaerolineae bacterium]
MLRLFMQEMRFRRNGIIGWGLGLCFFPVIYVGLYPSFADQLPNFQEMMDIALYQALGISMASFEGYVASTVTNLIPVILAIYAVISGTGTLAGEEDDGRLETIVALPIPRWQIVAVKATALGLALALILAVAAAGAGLTLAAIGSQVDTALTPPDLFWRLMEAWPLVLTFAMVSLFLGAFSPNRRTAAALATVLVVASYLGNNLAGMISSLERVKGLFLFNYFETTAEALLNGQQPANLLALMLAALAALGLAIFFFQRRDITVGAWPWQKGRVPA